MEARTRTWRPNSRMIAAAAALFVASVIFSESLRLAFFLFFLAFLLAVVLDYPVRLLARVIPRSVAAAAVLVLILGGLAAGVRFAVPPLFNQGARVLEQAPKSLDKAKAWWNSVRSDAPVDGIPTGQQIERDVKKSVSSDFGTHASAAVPIAATSASLIGSLVLLLVVATFMVANPEGYLDGIVWVLPPEHEGATREFLSRLIRTMRGWLTAQILSMSFVGVLTAVGLFAIGVPGWYALAVVNFVCEFVPFIGPFVGAAPGVAVAFADSTQKGAYAALLYLGIQQLEGNVVSPLMMRHEVKLAPPLLLLWQVVMATAFGTLGIIVATPLLACIKIAVDYFWVERTLGRKTAPA